MRLNRSFPAVSLAVFVFMAFSFSAQAAPERSVTVSGECVRRAIPDRGAIVVTADFLEPDLKSASRKATLAYERIKEAIKKLGLENMELRTTETTLIEQKEWEKNRHVSKGYRARMGLEVSTSEPQKLGEVVAIAARENVRDVGQLTTFLSEEKKQKEQMACLQIAAAHAKSKAERLAASLGAKVGDVLSIQESNASIPPIQPMAAHYKMAEASDAVESPRVEAGFQEVRTTIQAMFKLN